MNKILRRNSFRSRFNIFRVNTANQLPPGIQPSSLMTCIDSALLYTYGLTIIHIGKQKGRVVIYSVCRRYFYAIISYDHFLSQLLLQLAINDSLGVSKHY